MTNDELFGRLVGYTAVIVGWTFNSPLLLGVGTAIVLLEVFTTWGKM